MQTQINYLGKRNINYLAPQGWSYFTKEPKELRVKLFDLESNSEVKLSNISQSVGMNRSNRVLYGQLSEIAEKAINSNDVVEIECYNSDCFHPTLDSLKIINVDVPYLQKENRRYLLIVNEVIPWVWLSIDSFHMPTKAIILENIN